WFPLPLPNHSLPFPTLKLLSAGGLLPSGCCFPIWTSAVRDSTEDLFLTCCMDEAYAISVAHRLQPVCSARREVRGGCVAKEDRGFASMDRNKQRQIASKGGKAAQQKGTAHEWTSEEAREAGRMGGMASHRRKQEQGSAPEANTAESNAGNESEMESNPEEMIGTDNLP